MISVTQYVVSGSGEIPNSLEIGDTIGLDASGNSGTFFEWELVSKPKDSNAVLSSPISSVTQLGPVDAIGVYLTKLIIDRGLPTEAYRLLSFSVPAENIVFPDAPEFGQGGNVRNFSFELPGSYAGYAAHWAVLDESNILSAQAGILRGRIIPTNFNPTHGDYAFCLGDDIGSIASFYIGDEFSISQNVDFTFTSTLKIDIKFRK